jgi:hypothetical protein
MSRGEQLLSIIGDECMRRAEFALKSESYNAARAGGNFWSGPKGSYYASIACNAAPDGKMWINTVLASNRDDGGAERVRLQQRIDRPAGGDSCIVGTWNCSYTGGSGQVTINGDGTMTDGSKSGRWGLTDARTRTYALSWPNSTDTLVVSSDCRSLAGANNSGVRINATKR